MTACELLVISQEPHLLRSLRDHDGLTPEEIGRRLQMELRSLQGS